jgi:hypothetical protein
MLRPTTNAHFLRFPQSGDSPVWLGGESSFQNAFCPNCRWPLLVYIAIDTSHPLFAPAFPNCQKRSRFEVLFCSRCEVSWSDFRYRLDDSSGTVEVLEFCPGSLLESAPESVWVPNFGRHAARLAPVPMRIQELYLKDLGADQLSDSEKIEIAAATGEPTEGYVMAVAQSQLFGVPYMQQNVVEMKSSNGEPMQFLASLPWERGLPFQILEPDSQLMAWYCPESNEVVVLTVI